MNPVSLMPMRDARSPCEVCGKPVGTIGQGRCTNGRCASCHAQWCTPGGETSPGHNRRWPEGHAQAPKEKR